MTETVAAAELAALEKPIPADELGLAAYIRENRPSYDALGAYLADWLGAERADAVLDRAYQQVNLEDRTDEVRANLRANLDTATRALAAARGDLRELRGTELYDVEYAEGGSQITALDTILESAAHYFAAAKALNPAPAPAPVTSRRAILGLASLDHRTRTGVIPAGPSIDPLALAALVADGFGEFVRDPASPEQVKPVTGVCLNKGGYYAALRLTGGEPR